MWQVGSSETEGQEEKRGIELKASLIWIDEWISGTGCRLKGQSAVTSGSILDFVHLAFHTLHHISTCMYRYICVYRPHTNVYCALGDDTRLGIH